MNWAHVHLVFNHIPVIGVPLAFLLFLVALVRKSEELKKAGLASFILIALLALPAYLTGEPAEGIVRNLSDVSKEMIEEHEKAALFSLVALELLGVVSLTGLVLSRGSKPLPRWTVITCLILSLATATMMARTANLGGKVHHPEIRTESFRLAPNAPPCGQGAVAARQRWSDA
jgi:uncharacterized membrane protein